MDPVVIDDILKNVARIVSPELRLLFEHMLGRLDSLDGQQSTPDTNALVSDVLGEPDPVVSKRRQASNG